MKKRFKVKPFKILTLTVRANIHRVLTQCKAPCHMLSQVGHCEKFRIYWHNNGKQYKP